MKLVIFMKVLITHARGRQALAATRSLGRKNVEVITSDSFYPTDVFFSKYSKSYFIYPPFKTMPKQFIYTLKKYIQKKYIKVLIPTYVETYVISQYKNQFDSGVKIPIPKYSQILIANNKFSLLNFAKDIDIPIPKTYTIQNIKEVNSVAQKLDYPVVIKLVEGSGSKGIKYIYSRDEFAVEYKETIKKFRLKSSEYPLIQEYIQGTGYGVSMLFNQGDARAIFTHKRLREIPISGGPSTARISVRHSKMEKYALKLLTELNWHGVAMVEFKLDKRTKKPVLMEINPRFWGSLNLAVCSGVDFPYLLYKMAIEGDVKTVFNYKIGVEARWFVGDVRALVDYVRDKRFEKVKDFLKFYKVYYDEFSFNDPLPAIIKLIYSIKNFVTKGELSFVPKEERQ